MFELRYQTPASWANSALGDFSAFLNDHASCERKASAVGLSFVVRYPDRISLIEPMIQFAREELEHYHQVYRLMQARNISLGPDESDAYVNQMMDKVRHGRDERLLDRLLLSSIIEARGHERLELITAALIDPDLKAFYGRLARAEHAHKNLFIGLAELYFPMLAISDRLNELLDLEAGAIQSVPNRCALH